MHIEYVPNRRSHPTILLRQSYREGKKVKKRTLANLTSWPVHIIDGLKALLRGTTLAGEKLEEAFEVVRSRAHGHVAAVLGTLQSIGLDAIISRKKCRELQLVCAMIVARILFPCSKLATARGLDEGTGATTLSEALGVETVDEDDLYEALDWLYEHQAQIQEELAARHLEGEPLVLYDLSSSYFEGRTCPLARHGHSRDGKPDKLQIEYGLLCNRKGCPVAIEVFEGNVGDPKTFTPQVARLRERYNIKHVVWVGDRGMITKARIEQDLRGKEGLDWITALRSVEIRSLIESKALQLSIFDRTDMAEIKHPDYPGERLVVCKNPLLAAERTRKRNELLAATELELAKIANATTRKRAPLRGKDAIGLRVGKVISQHKMAKHFSLLIEESSFSYQRNESAIEQEQSMDGIYVIRTSVPAATLNSEETVLAYKSLSTVERAFRSLKTVDLKIRPIHHRLAERVKAHVFLCMLAYYVEWHMRQRLASILFDDDDPASAAAARKSPVAPAKRSERAQRKAAMKKNEEGFPVMSFHSLMASLSAVVKSTFRAAIDGSPTFDKITQRTALQSRAFDLLGVKL